MNFLMSFLGIKRKRNKKVFACYDRLAMYDFDVEKIMAGPREQLEVDFMRALRLLHEGISIVNGETERADWLEEICRLLIQTVKDNCPELKSEIGELLGKVNEVCKISDAAT